MAEGFEFVFRGVNISHKNSHFSLPILFNYSLNQGGIMMLGTAETISSSIKGFEVIDSKLKFYKRISKSVSPVARKTCESPSSPSLQALRPET